MGLFDAFTGSAQKRQIRAGMKEAQGYYGQAQQGLGTAYGNAQGRFAPYQQTGQQANALYGDFLGLHGQDAQRGAFDGYQASPYEGAMRANAERETARAFNARGLGGSGAEMNALYQRNAGLYNQHMQSYLDRLGAMQGQGASMAGQMAGIDMGYGNALAGIAGNQANTAMQGRQQLANAAGIGLQNAMGLGGLALQAFAPGAAGISPAGAFGQGVNSIFGPTAQPQTPVVAPYARGAGYGSFRAAQEAF